MKVIELLNKIANGKIPKKIKYRGNIYEYKEEYEDYKYYELDHYTYFMDFFTEYDVLNEEVEILEEEKKIPEKLNLDIDELKGKETPRAIDYLIESKINQVIDYLQSKGE